MEMETAPMGKVRSADGTTIAFDRRGEGSPIILVGGAFNDRNASASGAPLAELLAPHFTVFTYDRRGRGDSGDTAPYAVEREVEDLAALIKEAGGSAFVFGISSGAILALEAASRGLAITKPALYEPPIMVDGSGSQLPEGLATRLTELVAAGRRGDAVELFLTKAVGMPEEVVAQMRHAAVWSALQALAHTLRYDVTITRDFSLRTERVASVTVPTLVIGGDNSPPKLRHGVQAVADTLPNAQQRILEGYDHNVAPEALAPVLEAFFNG